MREEPFLKYQFHTGRKEEIFIKQSFIPFTHHQAPAHANACFWYENDNSTKRYPESHS
jgi:hypothetical protein